MISPESVNLDATPWDALSGQYQLRPGMQRSIVGQRPVLGAGRLGRLLRAQRGEQVSRTLTSLFTLCAHAHRRTAELALAAARAEAPEIPATDPPILLWIETARDHLRSIALDWPQRLPDLTAGARNMDWLRDSPLPLGTSRPFTDAAAAWEALTKLRGWLENRILVQSIPDWLAAHRHPDALAAWCNAQAARLLPARCLAAWYPIAHALKPETRCLDVLDEDPERQNAQLRQLTQLMVSDPDFVQRPTWLGRCAESGPWARLRHQREHAPTQHSSWTRLSARWMELMEIAAADPRTRSPGSTPLLASGALELSDGQALAWCEMARGLLLHWVQLDSLGGIQDYRVLAPTEWNFHPEGALARALTTLRPRDMVAARTLAAAFDPCVACTVQTPATEETNGA